MLQAFFKKNYVLVFSLFFATYVLFYFFIQKNELFTECFFVRNSTEKAQCLEKSIISYAEAGNINRAFDTVLYFYKTNEAFASDCHAYTHLIGQSAAKIFLKNNDIEVSKNAYYCGFGFYHGFAESVLFETGDLKKMKDFCSYMEKKLGGDTKGACYHGIGHGLTDGSDPRTWGNPQMFVKGPLEFCKQVGENEYFINRCASGVFNSLAIFFNNPHYEKYKLQTRIEDPYWICREQKEDYFKMPCYQEMDTVIFRLNDHDILRSIIYAEHIPENKYAQLATEELANFGFFEKNSSHSNYFGVIDFCRTIQNRLIFACLRGFGTGLVEHGPPEKEYEEGLRFCQLDELFPEEQKACLDRVVPYVKILYSEVKMKQICDTLINFRYKKFYCS